MGSASRRPILAPPRGFRDILPTEARELRAIERTLTDTFAGYGYMSIEPPMVEYAEGQPEQERLIQFLDSDSRLVALRPDLTTAIARLVAQRYREATGALRLSYFAPIFRESPAMTPGEREVVQAGIELIGPAGPLADAEVLALLVESLERCGLPLDASTIHVGHIGIVQRVFAALANDAQVEVLGALRGGDVAGALRRARASGMSDESVAEARHTLETVGGAIEQLTGPEVAELREVLHLARERWPGTVKLWGLPNVALLPSLPYYTGIVFEALHPEVGPIASGGRYDLLIGAFGTPRPATGFAVDVLRLHRALFAHGWRPPKHAALVALRTGPDQRATMRCAAALRAVGLSVAIGDVAETAGVDVVQVVAVDERRVELDGEVIGVDALTQRLQR